MIGHSRFTSSVLYLSPNRSHRIAVSFFTFPIFIRKTTVLSVPNNDFLRHRIRRHFRWRYASLYVYLFNISYNLSNVGGASGCVIAGRLAAADPTLKILILESGPHTRDDFAHVQPARYLSHLQPESTTVKFYAGNKSDALGGRSPIVPVGQCFGGGSSVNCKLRCRTLITSLHLVHNQSYHVYTCCCF